jgi:hypothetical protein
MIRPVDVVPYHFFVWCEQTNLAVAIKTSTWMFAIIETVHIMTLSILLGTTLVVDLRLLGFGLRRSATPQVAHELEPWTWVTLAITILTGICLFASEALKLSHSGPFFYKMVFFIAAILLHFTIHWKATMQGARDGAFYGKVAACLSLICWLGVALSGRAIAFL